jgi:FkbM family methyltransferase
VTPKVTAKPTPVTTSVSRLAQIALLVNNSIARSRIVSWVWLRLFSAVLRRAPESRVKASLINHLARTRWNPKLRFSAKSVDVCPGVTIKLVPHVGEFDFRAAFTRTLGYEADVFTALLARMSRYDAVLEIGANVGVFSLFFRRQRRDHNVPIFCFDPSREAFSRLLDNLAIDREPNVFAIPAAVAGSPGLAQFYEPQGHLTNGSLIAEFAGIFSETLERRFVPCVCGAQLLELLAPYSSLLIKIDVEGAESVVLRGLMPLILAKQPDMVIEVLESYAGDLNALGLEQTYDLSLITADGLKAKANFEADSTYRDYLLTARTVR